MTDFGCSVHSLEFLSEIHYNLYKKKKMRVIIKIQQRNYLLCEVTCLFFLNLNNNQSNQHPSVLQYIQVTQNLYIKLFV